MALRDELRDTYQQAAKEVEQKTRTFWERHKAKAARKLKEVDEGKITLAEYKNWLAGQVFTGERWTEKLDDITQTFVDADKKAREIIGGTTKNVFVRFANSTAKDVEEHIKGGYSFDLYDKHTVERLLKENPDLLPKWKINEAKDYKWNQQRVKNAITQGIIQGESIDDIGKRLTKGLSAKNADHMVMFARTAVTGAQNAGRMERLHEAQDLGIKVRKKWLATTDNRTRDAHKDLNGVEADIDEPFHSELGDIMFPGDPTADPANVYNCRCTLAYVYPKYQQTVKPQEEQEEPEVIPFEPSKTRKEAEGYASSFAQNVSYNGLTVDGCNAVNEELNILTRKFPINRYKEISTSAKINAHAQASGSRLVINPKKIVDEQSSITAFKAMQQFRKYDIKAILTKYPDGNIPLVEAQKLAKLERKQKFARGCVSHTYGIKATIAHEYGHTLSDQYFGMINGVMANLNANSPQCQRAVTLVRETYEKARDNGDVFKISSYADTDEHEFFAEVFCAREMGEELPSYIVSMLVEVLKNGIM